MAETLGSLCDKLTIVKLKQYHTEEVSRLKSLSIQEKQLCEEINSFVMDSLKGLIPHEKLVFSSNKIYKKEGNEIEVISGSIGLVFAELAGINCKLWHEQEKVYAFETVPPDEKDLVVKKLALLNLQRNQCIDEINTKFQQIVVNIKNF